MMWLALLLLWQADPDQARFEQAQQLAAQGRCRDAAPVFQQLAAAHPHSAAIPFALGQCEFNGKDCLAALDAFDRALQIDPQMVEARALYGAALGLSGRTAEAIVQLRASAALSDKANAVRFMTGSVPGMPMQTGQVAELGGKPNLVLHPQKSFVFVRSCTWTSRPMMVR